MMNTPLFQWVILPLLIFLSRIVDVSLDTLRILFFWRGRSYIAPVLGFIQVIIWLLVIRQIFLNLSNPICYIAYAGGFATGTWVGMLIEEKMAVGVQVIRTITSKDASELINFLKTKGFSFTYLEGQGTRGKVNIIYTIVKRQSIPEVIKIIKRFNPRAFYTIEDIRSISEEFYHQKRRLFKKITRN